MTIDRVSAAAVLPHLPVAGMCRRVGSSPENAFIEALHQEKKKNDLMATTVATMLNNLIIPSLTSECVLYELLQNADDAPADHPLDVQIKLQGDWIVFSHSGRDFTEDDVRSISSAAQSTKSEDIKLIGNKGVGFKSVFSLSSCIYILTPTYRFSFNKDFRDWKEQKTTDKQQYPWQIIPIAVSDEEIPDEIDYQNNERITFAIKIHSDSKLHECQAHIKKLIDNPSVLAFLNNVNKITIENGSVSTSLVRENQQWTVGDCSWTLHTMTQKLPEAFVRESILPEKYKKVTSLDVTIALCHKDNKLVALPSSPLFAFLPTDEEIGLPFYVNAAFMLDNSRTKLHQDAKQWNSFLLETIAYRQFELFCTLGSPPEIGSLITHPSQIVVSHHKKLFQEAYRKGFSRAMQTLAFVPTVGGKKLLMQDAIFDPYGFIDRFGTADEKARKAHPDFALSPECERDYPCFSRITFDTIAQEIVKRRELFSDPEKALELLQFLYAHRNHLSDHFKALPLFLSHTGCVVSSSELFFPYAAIGYTFAQLNSKLLHEQVYKGLSAESILWIEKFFQMGRADVKTLLLDINTTGSESERVDTVICAFKLNREGILRDEDIPELQIKTGDGFKKPSLCYLHSCYAPEISLDDVIDPSHIVSQDYFARADGAPIREFLLKLGVNGSFSPEYIKDVSFVKERASSIRFILELFKLWEKNREKIAACDLGNKVFIATKNGVHLAREVYLPDVCQPKDPLETACAGQLQVVDLNSYKILPRQVSGVWKQFFIAIGVGETVDFRLSGPINAKMCLVGQPNPRPYGKPCVEIKQDTPYTSFVNYSGNIPSYWNGWEQWVLTGFFEIPFYEAIKKTPVLWTQIQKQWRAIALSLEQFQKSTIGSRDKPPLHFYLQNVVPIQGGGSYKSPNDCLNPNLSQMLVGSSLPRAVLPCTFTDDQYKEMGFQEKLSARDSLVVLQALSRRSGVDSNTIKRWICLLYRWILSDQYLLTTETDIRKKYSNRVHFTKRGEQEAQQELNRELELFRAAKGALRDFQGPVYTHQGTFIPLKNSCYQMADDAHAPHSLWRPPELSKEDFKKLCTFFSLTEIAPPVVLTNETVGRIAEESVYEYLKRKYGPKIQETESGFTTEKVTVIWHQFYSEKLRLAGRDKEADAQKFYESDFTIKREGKKEKRIEVKASRNSNGVDGIFSTNELRVLKRAELGEIAYQVIHIRNIAAQDKAQYKWKKVKNITKVLAKIPDFESDKRSLPVDIQGVKISFDSIPDYYEKWRKTQNSG